MVENILITSRKPFSFLPSPLYHPLCNNLSKKKQYKIKLMEKSSIVIGVCYCVRV
jgi:hypothetical protein